MLIYVSEKGYCYKYIDDQKIRISREEYDDIFQKGGNLIKDKVPNIHEISKDVKRYIDYPYMKYFIDKDLLHQRYKMLKRDKLLDYVENYDISKQDTLLDKKDRLILDRAFLTGYAYEILMEYFQEDSRNKCNREGYPSPWEAYIEPKYNKQWIKKFYSKIINKHNIVLPLREDLGSIYRKSCDAFPANLALWLMNKWKPKKILMMSGAWGDEIIATMAYGKHTMLTAVDPNTSAVKNWYDMIDFYDPDNSDKYKFHIKPFEDVVLGEDENGYDMMYSSPPYFSAEHYSEDEDQSYLKFKTREEWIEGFLKPSLEKVWDLMAVKGVVILALNDVNINGKVIRLVQPMHDIMDSLYGSKYIGTYGFKKMKGQKNYQPLFCWRKIKV